MLCSQAKIALKLNSQIELKAGEILLVAIYATDKSSIIENHQFSSNFAGIVTDFRHKLADKFP